MTIPRFRPKLSASFLLCIGCALVVAAPLWLHRWLPIQDLPQHLATLRIVHDVHTGGPEGAVYAVDMLKTQYVLFYLAGDLLSYVCSVRSAALLFLTAYMVGTVGAMYALLKELGKDPRLSLLAVPLLTNTQLLIGLLQFLIGLPLTLYGWSLALLYLRTERRRYGIALAVVAVLTFYSHIVAFGILVIGLAIIAPYSSIRRLLRFSLTLLPAGLFMLRWAFFTESGAFVRSTVVSGAENKDLWPFHLSFHSIYGIAFDTYRDSADEKIFAEASLVAIALTLLTRRRVRSAISTARWALVPLVCFFLYFRSEGTNGFLGHIRDRFALFGMFALIPLFRMPKGIVGALGTVAMTLISLETAETFDWHCSRFEREEVGDFDQALDHIAPGKRVAGLILSSDSKYFSENPFLHYAAYYLVEKGGSVNFSFAGYPHWVYSYRPHMDPLGASPPVFLWEWRPDHIAPREELAPSYDFVLTRGPGLELPDDLYWKAWEGTRWSVWERRSQ